MEAVLFSLLPIQINFQQQTISQKKVNRTDIKQKQCNKINLEKCKGFDFLCNFYLSHIKSGYFHFMLSEKFVFHITTLSLTEIVNNLMYGICL